MPPIRTSMISPDSSSSWNGSSAVPERSFLPFCDTVARTISAVDSSSNPRNVPRIRSPSVVTHYRCTAHRALLADAAHYFTGGNDSQAAWNGSSWKLIELERRRRRQA